MKNKILSTLIATVVQASLFLAYLYSKSAPEFNEVLYYCLGFLLTNVLVYFLVIPLLEKEKKAN